MNKKYVVFGKESSDEKRHNGFIHIVVYLSA